MPTRQVNTTLATYIDEAGKRRTALRGAEVSVHPGFVNRFDRLNVVNGVEAVTAEVAEDDAPVEGLAEWLTAESAWGELVGAWLAAESTVKAAEDIADTAGKLDEALGGLSDNAAAEVLNLKPRRAKAS